MVSRMPSDDHDNIQQAAFDGTVMMLRGKVGRIIPSLVNGVFDAVEIVIEGAEDLYREIRIHNLLQDANGNVVVPQPGSEVEITIKVRAESPARYEDEVRRKSA